MASLTFHQGGVPLIMPVGDNGTVSIPESLLCVQFGYRSGMIHIEQEVFDSDGVHEWSIYQVNDHDIVGYVWNLCRSSFKVYGITHVQMSDHASTAVITLPVDSSHTVLVPGLSTKSIPTARVFSDTKVEDLFDVNLDESMNPFKSHQSAHRIVSTSDPSSSQMSLSHSTKKPPVHPSSRNVHSILMHIRHTCNRKRFRSELSRLDIDSFDLNHVKKLPPKNDGDMIFELLQLSEDIPVQFRGVGLDGMSKQYDGHKRCKTMM